MSLQRVIDLQLVDSVLLLVTISKTVLERSL